jgi:hypothetical protein
MRLLCPPSRRQIWPVFAGLALVSTSALVRADSIVNFWLANADVGPATPVIYALPGAAGHLDVWARPAVGYRLSAFSLDLQSATPGVVAFTSVDVLNPQFQAMPDVFRHQVVFDSESGLFVTDDEIYGFLGFSFFNNAMGLSNGTGIGPMCGLDPDCFSATGAPAWRVAIIEYQAGMALGSTELFLAIGEQGLWQSPAAASEPDAPTDTSAVFGLPNDAVNQWGTLVGTDHRHDPQGLADALIQVASADFNEDGDINGADFLIWQRGLGVGSSLEEGDANGDGQVNGTDLAVWRFQFGATGAVVPAGSAVPEPTGIALITAIAGLVRLGPLSPRRCYTARLIADPNASNAASQSALSGSALLPSSSDSSSAA